MDLFFLEKESFVGWIKVDAREGGRGKEVAMSPSSQLPRSARNTTTKKHTRTYRKPGICPPPPGADRCVVVGLGLRQEVCR